MTSFAKNYNTDDSESSRVTDSSKALLSPEQARTTVAEVIHGLEAKNLDWSVILAVMADMALNRGQSQLAKTLVEAAHAVYQGTDFLDSTDQFIR